MAKYRAYPEYKDSGVEWLGEVPEHWLIKKLKYLCTVQTGSRDTVNAVEEGLYPFFVRSQTIERINSVGADCEAVLTAGDGVGVGKVYHYYNGKFDYHQRVYMLNKFKFITGRFVFYYLSSNFYKVALEGNAKSTVDSLRLPQFLNFEFSIPSIKEQTFITTFLDHETAKIDNLIEKQQQLIKLLKEKRQAVISHAVTKGLNPDVPMKDSGVEWLGEVPEHWNVKKLKYLCESIISGPFGSSITKDMYVKSGYKVYGQEQVIPNDFNIGDYYISEADFKSLSRYSVNPGDILISCVGTFGKIAVFPEWAESGIINPRLIKATLNNEFNSDFIREFLKSEAVSKQFELLSRGGTMGVINISILNEILISSPSYKEQIHIVSFIHKQNKMFQKLIERAVSQIELLQERRTALISAAVTGKIDVRNWVAPEAEKAEVSQEATA